MTYSKTRHGEGNSTKLISSRIQKFHVEFAEEHGFNFNRLVNKALDTLVHELQVDLIDNKFKYKLRWSSGGYTGYYQDLNGSVTKMLRVKTMNHEYLTFNQWKVNTAINLALERWEVYFRQGKVHDYVIEELRKKHAGSQNKV